MIRRVLRLLLLLSFVLFKIKAADTGLQYQLNWVSEAEKSFNISLRVSPSKGKTTSFKIPAWRPGRYILQNYSAAVSHVVARTEDGSLLPFQKLDKDTWQVVNPSKGKIVFQYRYYAGVLDAGSSFIGKDIYYFNGINLFAYIPERLSEPCTLTLPVLSIPGNTLKVATALPGGEKGIFVARDYHHLVDCPVVISSRIRTLTFQENGATFYLHFQGNYRGNADTDEWLKTAAARLFREQAAVFNQGFPFKEYHCLYILSPYNFRHAVEHATSSCYTLPEESTSSIEAIQYGILGITSHEFFHVWNVKRIRPSALLPYNYEKEAYTGLHWFTEGVTSYMEQLTLARAGLRTEQEFLSHLSSITTQLENAYSSDLISCEMSSFDSWLSQARIGNPWHRTSFYSMGERAGFLLDLLLRKYSEGNQGIEELFRRLDTRYGLTGKGMPENGVEQVAIEMAGEPARIFFNNHIRGVVPIEYNSLLSPLGLKAVRYPDSMKTWERLGLQVQKESGGIFLRVQVKPGSDAMKAGISDDDLIVEVFNKPLAEADITRLTKLQTGDSIPVRILSAGVSQIFTIVYSGIHQPFTLKFQADTQASTEVRLSRESWLNSLLPDEK
jgi:predicted metalloprotease with PDZ domain